MAEIVWPMVLRGVLPELPLALLFGAAAATGADAIATAASVVMAATLNFTEILLSLTATRRWPMALILPGGDETFRLITISEAYHFLGWDFPANRIVNPTTRLITSSGLRDPGALVDAGDQTVGSDLDDQAGPGASWLVGPWCRFNT